MTPQISVIIPTYLRPELLRQCLNSLAQQTLTMAQFEVVVVDDDDQPQTALTARKAIQETGLSIRYLAQPQRRGLTAARNRGWRVALAPLIAFINDDCMPDSKWLEVALTRFERGAAVLTGQLRMSSETGPVNQADNVSRPEVTEFSTANVFCRRSVLEAVGGFDEAFDAKWREEKALQFKLLRLAIPIVDCPEAIIHCPQRTAPWYAPLGDEQKSRYDALLYRKHPDLFKQYMPVRPMLVWRYYLTVSIVLVSILAAIAGQLTMVIAGLLSWLLLTICLLIERLLAEDRFSLSLVGQAFIVSVGLPFLSVYWRLYGAVKYRALFW